MIERCIFDLLGSYLLVHSLIFFPFFQKRIYHPAERGVQATSSPIKITMVIEQKEGGVRNSGTLP